MHFSHSASAMPHNCRQFTVAIIGNKFALKRSPHSHALYAWGSGYANGASFRFCGGCVFMRVAAVSTSVTG